MSDPLDALVEDERQRVRAAVREAFGDLGFEYGDPPNALPDWDEVRTYRKHDNVRRPGRFVDNNEVRYEHGLVVHRLTTLLAVQRAEIRRLRELAGFATHPEATRGGRDE